MTANTSMINSIIFPVNCNQPYDEKKCTNLFDNLYILWQQKNGIASIMQAR